MSIVPLPHSINSFRDALGLAFELSDEFAFAHAALVLGPDRRCIDFEIFTAIGDNLSEVLSWLSSRVETSLDPALVLLISVRSVDGWSIYEQDLSDFRFARSTISGYGGTLLDWIETDGELVRSYAYLVNPNTAWSVEAGAEGALEDLGW